jgi:hypothetical protein
MERARRGETASSHHTRSHSSEKPRKSILLDAILIISAVILTFVILLIHPDPTPESRDFKMSLERVFRRFRSFFVTLLTPVNIVMEWFWSAVTWILKGTLKLPLIGPIVYGLFWLISLPFKFIAVIVNPSWADNWGPEPPPCPGFLEKLLKLQKTVDKLKDEILNEAQ